MYKEGGLLEFDLNCFRRVGRLKRRWLRYFSVMLFGVLKFMI